MIIERLTTVGLKRPHFTAKKKQTGDNLYVFKCLQSPPGPWNWTHGEISHHNSFSYLLSQAWDVLKHPWGHCDMAPCCCMVNMNQSEAKKLTLTLQHWEVFPSWLTHENADIPCLIIIPVVHLISQASALNPGWVGSRSSAVSQHLSLQTKGIRKK